MADRTWQPDGPHRWTLRMGPVTASVYRCASRGHGWFYRAHVLGGQIAYAFAAPDGLPLAQCQADAIAAVEAWRDSIR